MMTSWASASAIGRARQIEEHIFQIGFADLAGATLGFLIGGVAAAPIGAFAAKHFSTKWMLVMVGVVLIITSAYGIWSARAG